MRQHHAQGWKAAQKPPQHRSNASAGRGPPPKGHAELASPGGARVLPNGLHARTPNTFAPERFWRNTYGSADDEAAAQLGCELGLDPNGTNAGMMVRANGSDDSLDGGGGSAGGLEYVDSDSDGDDAATAARGAEGGRGSGWRAPGASDGAERCAAPMAVTGLGLMSGVSALEQRVQEQAAYIAELEDQVMALTEETLNLRESRYLAERQARILSGRCVAAGLPVDVGPDDSDGGGDEAAWMGLGAHGSVEHSVQQPQHSRAGTAGGTRGGDDDGDASRCD